MSQAATSQLSRIPSGTLIDPLDPIRWIVGLARRSLFRYRARKGPPQPWPMPNQSQNLSRNGHTLHKRKTVALFCVHKNPTDRGCQPERRSSVPPGQAPQLENRRSQNHSERSEEHTSELQSRFDLVCRLLLEKK